MGKYENALQIMAGRFGRDSIVSVATVGHEVIPLTSQSMSYQPKS